MKRSFLRWMGGKSKFIKQFKLLFKKIGPGAKYIEPFLGSGIVFFNFEADKYLISDQNKELINCFKVLRSSSSFADLIIELQKPVYKNDRNSFTYCRDRYNEIKDDPLGNLIEQVALFIYINHNCFNGQYRVNSLGKFNTPFGEVYKIPFFARICSTLAKAHDRLNSRVVTMVPCHYSRTLEFAKAGDFVYLDPPYYPINKDSFVEYTKEGFSEQEHLNLIDWCNKLDQKGCFVMYSNSNVDFIKDHFKALGPQWIIIEFTRSGSCGGNEVLIKNYAE